MNNPSVVRREILTSLVQAKPYALPQSGLLTAVNTRLRPRLSAESLESALSDLESHGYAATLDEEFGDDEKRWLITEPGEAYLKR